MSIKIEASWKEQLAPQFSQSYFEQLIAFVKTEYAAHTCYPPGGKIFSAFDHTPFNDVKVVILGQDPYHGPRQANGLCFSVSDGIPAPPSLINIFKEIEDDLGNPAPATGNLERWANQGVLLLNAILTVQAHNAASHQGKGWEQFTDAVLDTLSRKRDNLVFLFWGGYAKKKGKLIDRSRHFVLESGHPSPLSANRGYWFGNKHFSQANAYLEKQGKSPINW